MAESSIHFDKSKPNWEQHMLRTSDKLPTYLLDPKDRLKENEYQEPTEQDVDLFNAEMALLKGRGKRPKLENCQREAVVNLNENHTMEDVLKVAKLCEKTFGIKCTCIAIHHDEGYKDDFGQVHFNHHAHLHFFTMQNGKQMWQLGKTKRLMSKLQTDVAKVLGMKRGKEKSEAQRLEHKQYKAVVKEKEKLLKKIKQLSKKRSKATKNALSYRRQKKELMKELAKLELRIEKPTLLDSVKNFLNQPKEPKQVQVLARQKTVVREMSEDEIKRTDTYQDLLQKNTVFHNALKTAKERIDNLTSELADKNQEIEKLKLQLKSLEEQKKQWITENQKAKEQSQPQVHSQDDYKPLNAQIREVKAEIKQAEKPIEKPKETMPLEFLLNFMPDVVMNVKRTFPHVSDFNQVKTWCWQYVLGHADEEFSNGKDIDETILKGSLYVTKQIRQKILQSTSIPSDNTLLQKMLGHPLETQPNSNLSTSNDRVEQSDNLTVGKSSHRSR